MCGASPSPTTSALSRRKSPWTIPERPDAGIPSSSVACSASSVGRLAGARGIQLPLPGRELAREVAVGTTEVGEAHGRRIDGVQRRRGGRPARGSARAAPRACRRRSACGGRAPRPGARSIRKKSVPVTSRSAESSTRSIAVGTGTALPRSAEMTRCSRRMSCALESTWPSGGRRRMSGSRAPSTAYVRLLRPPAITVAERSPEASSGCASASQAARPATSSPGTSVIVDPPLARPRPRARRDQHTGWSVCAPRPAPVGWEAYRWPRAFPHRRDARKERTMVSKLGNITFYADDPRALSHFWAGVFGYPPAEWEEPLKSELLEAGLTDDDLSSRSVAEDPDGVGPRLFFHHAAAREVRPQPAASRHQRHARSPADAGGARRREGSHRRARRGGRPPGRSALGTVAGPVLPAP